MSEYIVKVEGQIPDAIYERQLEEIVRCHDCRYCDTHTEPTECYKEVPGRIVAPDGYCKWGERK